MDDQSLIIVGNIFDGYVFYGPFEDHDAAVIWAEDNIIRNEEWLVVATLRNPTKED